MQPKKFTMNAAVTSFDVGRTRQLKYSMILRYLQEVAGRQLDDAGLPYDTLRSRGFVFLLTRVFVRIESLPRAGELAEMETWFAGLHGAQFERHFRLKGEHGAVEARSLWVTVDPESHRILRPSAFPAAEIMQPYTDDRAEVPECAFAAPVGEGQDRPVRWSDIDCNGHMNNAVYADLLCDAFPGGLGGRELSYFALNFRHEALEGDLLRINSSSAEDGTVFVGGSVGGRECFYGTARLKT